MINFSLLLLTIYFSSNTLINYTNCNKIFHEILEDLNALKIDITYKSDINFDAYKKILSQVTEDNGPPPHLPRLLNQ